MNPNIKLWLPLCGKNGSTVFKDYSASNHTAINDGASLSTSYFYERVSAIYCNGSTNVNFADSDDWDFDTGAFTIWLKMFPTLQSGVQEVLTHGGNSAVSDHAGWSIILEPDRLEFVVWSDPSTRIVSIDISTAGIKYNQWNDVMVTRDTSGLITLWLNKVPIGREIDAQSLSYGTDQLRIGASWNSDRRFTGYIDEVIIVKGEAWDSHIFLPDDYSLDPYTNVLLHMNGTNGSTSFIDSTNRHVFTRSGTAQISTTTSKLGGACGYFDGSSYISTPYTSDFLWNENVTIDFWLYPTNLTGARCITAMSNGATISVGNFYIYYNSTLKFGGWGTTAWSEQDTGITLSINEWQHIALIVNNGTVMVAKNGTILYSQALNYYVTLTGALTIARPYNVSAFVGYVDEYRICNRSVRWATDFIPSLTEYTHLLSTSTTLPLPTTAWKFGEYSVYDCIGSNHLTNSGVTFATEGLQGRKCASFSGSGDTKLTVASSSVFDFGAGDFTIAVWMNPTTPPDGTTAHHFINRWLSAGGDWYFIWFSGEYGAGYTGKFRFGSNIGTVDTIDTGVRNNTGWHLAVVKRTAGVLNISIDATSKYNGAYSGTIQYTPSTKLGIGKIDDHSGDRYTGSIQDILIYKGTALSDSAIMELYNEGRSKLLYLDAKQHTWMFGHDYLDSYINQGIVYYPLNQFSGITYDKFKHNNLTNNGNIVNTTDAKFGKVSSFNGTSQYFSNATTNLVTGKFTFSTWFNVASTGAYLIAQFGCDSVGFLVYIGGSSEISFGFRGYAAKYASTSTPNNWMHLVITYSGGAKGDNASFTMSINGSSVTLSTGGTNGGSSNTVSIGKDGGSAWYYSGKMFGMCLFNEVIDSKGVAYLYNNGNGRFPTYNWQRNRPISGKHVIDVWPLGESSGNRIGHYSGLIATDNNTVGTALAKLSGLSASFNGTNEWFKIADTEYDVCVLMATGSYTVATWLRSTSETTSIAMGGMSATGGIYLYMNTTSGAVSWYTHNGSSGTHTQYNGGYNDGKWHRVIAMQSGTTVKLYIDNVLVAQNDSASVPGDAAQDGFGIGANYENGTPSSYWNGKMQELIFLDVPVDEKWIEDDWNTRYGRFII